MLLKDEQIFPNFFLTFAILFSLLLLLSCGIMQQDTNCKFLSHEILLGNKPDLIVQLTLFYFALDDKTL